MNGLSKICLILSIVTGALGLLAGHEHPILGGSGRALAGVFFIVFFICHIFQNEKLDADLKRKSH
jgi:hypothetical protein